ncbi:MAG: hypothetical protein ABR600_13680 [Actinomycetota bacterium]
MARVLGVVLVLGLATAVVPAASASAPSSGAGIRTTAVQDRAQRVVDRRVWASPARRGMTSMAETLLAMRLGVWQRPAGALHPSAPSTVVFDDAPGSNVRVSAASEDLKSACTTQSETSIVAVDDQRLVTAYNNSANGCYALDSYSGFAYSTNGGSSWTDGGAIEPPVGGFSGGDPSLAVDHDTGRVYLATLENAPAQNPTRVGTIETAGRSYIGVRTSDDGGKTWSAPTDGTDGLVGDHDKELLAVDNSGGPNDGTVYLAWTDFAAGQARGVITFSRSTDHGATWSDPIRLSHTDTLYNQGAYPVVGPNGELYVTWTTQLTPTPGIWFTKSLDGGGTFSSPKRIRTIQGVGHALSACGRDGMNGDIRMLSWSTMAVDTTPITDPAAPPPSRGTIYISYASQNGTDEGDVYLIRSTDGGLTWNPPAPSLGVRVNDDTTTRDQFMQGIAAQPNGEVALFWYDRRADAANTNIEVYAARSTDGGQTFGPNLKVGDVAFEGIGNNNERDPGVASCYMGDYMQMTPVSGGYAADWGDNRDRYPGVQGQGFRSDPNVYFSRISFPA